MMRSANWSWVSAGLKLIRIEPTRLAPLPPGTVPTSSNWNEVRVARGCTPRSTGDAPLEWRDKELSQILGQSGSRNQRVDLLAKVSLLSGEPQWILLHLEIQSSSEPEFAQRIARYNSGLFWTLQQRVVTLAVLADLAPEWRPCEDRFRLADFESCLRFPICKLVDKLEGEWREEYSLPVQVARAQIAALRTAGDPEGRFRAKWQLVRNLYGAGYNAEQVRELFRLIDWMMHLRSDWERRFRGSGRLRGAIAHAIHHVRGTTGQG